MLIRDQRTGFFFSCGNCEVITVFLQGVETPDKFRREQGLALTIVTASFVGLTTCAPLLNGWQDVTGLADWHE